MQRAHAATPAEAPLVGLLDLDCFYAAVEQLDDPALRGRPVVVGGDPRGRGVVATASYEARRFGIRSAMPAAEALRLCPQATFLRPDFERYRRRSREVWAIVERHIARVEQVGIDEGYLDLERAGADVGRAARVLRRLQAAIRAETGLSCSIGCGGSKTVAKIAADLRKPGGLTVVPPAESAAFLAPLPVRSLPGIGPRSEERLLAAGISTIGLLAAAAADTLPELLGGKLGRELRERARGLDRRRVDPAAAEPVSLGCEETFERDLTDLDELERWLERLGGTAWQRLERHGLPARTVSVKVRYRDFQTLTRAVTLAAPLSGEEQLLALARERLAAALEARRAPVRLLGVYLSGLGRRAAPHEQLELPLAARRGAAEPPPRRDTGVRPASP